MHRLYTLHCVWPLFRVITFEGIQDIICTAHTFIAFLPASIRSSSNQALFSSLVFGQRYHQSASMQRDTMVIPFAGAATTGALVGMTDYELQLLGRWSSDAYQRYIRAPIPPVDRHVRETGAVTCP